MPPYEEDFHEIAHSGGTITFTISRDEQGHTGYSQRISHSSMGPVSMFALYALPEGIACGDIQLGGIGDRWNPPPVEECVAVFISSDSEGRFGHECPICNKYWRSGGAPTRWPMTCPYCGIRLDTYQFVTAAQKRYIKHYVDTLFGSLRALSDQAATSEAVIDMSAIAKAEAGTKPDFYYSGQAQQTQFDCVDCGLFNDIRGQFGYCSLCGTRNNGAWADAEFQRIRDQLNARSITPGQALREAVSAFDTCARNLAAQLVDRIPMTARRKADVANLLFHSVEKCERIAMIFDIDLMKGMSPGQKKSLVQLFVRRHAFEHDGGLATERYIQQTGDTTVRPGDLIREAPGTVHERIGHLHKMIANFADGFLELFPPEELPVRLERERQARMRAAR